MTLALAVGRAVYESLPPVLQKQKMTKKDDKVLEEWGKAIIEKLRQKSIYVQVGQRGDPAGKWFG